MATAKNQGWAAPEPILYKLSDMFPPQYAFCRVHKKSLHPAIRWAPAVPEKKVLSGITSSRAPKDSSMTPRTPDDDKTAKPKDEPDLLSTINHVRL